MQLTNDTKLKLFAQYIGQTIELNNEGSTVRNRILAGVGGIGDGNFQYLTLRMGEKIVHSVFVSDERCKLVLKPLSELSDEDAIEICRLTGTDESHARFTTESAIRIGKRMVNDLVTLSPKDNTEPYRVILIYGFLQSKGYDLPQYLLKGQTLQQLGLAIYEY